MSGKGAREAEGVKGYVFITLAVLVAGVLGWVWWLDAAMGGGREDRPGVQVDLGGEPGVWADGGRPTVISLQAPTRTPRPTASPIPTGVSSSRSTAERPVATRVPVATETVAAPSVLPFSPTAVGEQVLVLMSRYWPDDGPEWCLTWDEGSGRCISPLTSGDDFRAFEGRAFACDGEWLGKRLIIPGLNLAARCLDTGISFGCDGGPCTVGLLQREGEVAGVYSAVLDEE